MDPLAPVEHAKRLAGDGGLVADDDTVVIHLEEPLGARDPRLYSLGGLAGTLTGLRVSAGLLRSGLLGSDLVVGGLLRSSLLGSGFLGGGRIGGWLLSGSLSREGLLHARSHLIVSVEIDLRAEPLRLHCD